MNYSKQQANMMVPMEVMQDLNMRENPKTPQMGTPSIGQKRNTGRALFQAPHKDNKYVSMIYSGKYPGSDDQPNMNMQLCTESPNCAPFAIADKNLGVNQGRGEYKEYKEYNPSPQESTSLTPGGMENMMVGAHYPLHTPNITTKSENMGNLVSDFSSPGGSAYDQQFHKKQRGNPGNTGNTNTNPNTNPSPMGKGKVRNGKIQDIQGLFKILSTAFAQFSKYDCMECINTLKYLPQHHQHTAYIQVLLGKCYFEQIKYKEAEKYFSTALKLECYRMEGLEYYSTCLWHLRKSGELTKLSRHVLDMSQYSPETWCVVGNCYSLQREHEVALRFFNRAIQIDQGFGYAHTMSGHEYVSNMDFDTAKHCFETAIGVDTKNYNAWWGLGNIYLKQEKFQDAIKYFTYATEINKKSGVLFTYLGLAYSFAGKLEEALKNFNISETIDNESALNKFQTATVLMSMQKYRPALKILTKLAESNPKEAPIHIKLGKIYKKLGIKENALKHWSIAMDLDPTKDNNVKNLIDNINNSDDINDTY